MAQSALTSGPGEQVNIPISTFDSNGALINADADPTITSIHQNGTAINPTATVVQLQTTGAVNIVGRYQVQVDGATFVAGDEIYVFTQAVIGGATRNGQDIVSIRSNAVGSGPSIQ